MTFDPNKPATNGSLSSAEMRDNFQHLKNSIAKEHNWSDSDPTASSHRLDAIKEEVSGSRQGISSAFQKRTIWSDTKVTTTTAAPAQPSNFPVTPDVMDSNNAFSVVGKQGKEISRTNFRNLTEVIGDGIGAGTYSLASLLQELVNRSHRHVLHGNQGYSVQNCDCNCDCNCNCNDGSN